MNKYIDIDNTNFKKTSESNNKIKVKFYTPIINWSDIQFRIARNGKGIKWEGKVHETLVCDGIKTTLPLENNYSILHFKEIERQRRQNLSYETGDYTK